MAAVVLSACRAEKASDNTIAPGPSTTAPVTVPSTTSTTVADGRVPAYLKTLDVPGRTLTYDQIQFLTGAEAKKAFVKDHPDQPDGPDNDYYIVNVNPALYTVPVAAGATVTLNVLADGSSTDQPSTLEKLADGLKKDGSETIPFWLTIKAGAITKIEEQFVP